MFKAFISRLEFLHILIGVLAGFCVTTAPTLYLEVPWGACLGVAFLLMGNVWKRQDLEFQEVHDTPGIDLAFYMAGSVDWHWAGGTGMGVEVMSFDEDYDGHTGERIYIPEYDEALHIGSFPSSGSEPAPGV